MFSLYSWAYKSNWIVILNYCWKLCAWEFLVCLQFCSELSLKQSWEKNFNKHTQHVECATRKNSLYGLKAVPVAPGTTIFVDLQDLVTLKDTVEPILFNGKVDRAMKHGLSMHCIQCNRPEGYAAEYNFRYLKSQGTVEINLYMQLLLNLKTCLISKFCVYLLVSLLFLVTLASIFP